MKLTNELVSVILAVSDQKDLANTYLAELYSTLTAHFDQFEILLVDDGSTDGTDEHSYQWVAQYPGLRYLRLSRRFGPEVALTAGLDAAIGDYCVTVLPDSDPHALIPKLVEQCQKSGAIVVGKLAKPEAEYGIFSRVVRRVLLWFSDRYLGVKIPEGMTHFVALDRQAVQQISRTRDKLRFLVSLKSYLGMKITRFEYEPLHGYRREPSWKRYPKALQNSLDLVVLNSSKPLRLVTLVSLGISFLNSLYIGYIVALYLIRNRLAEGWVTTSFQNSLNFFLLFLTLSVLSEYLGRVLTESKDRPFYFLLEERSGAAQVANEGRRNVLSHPVEVAETRTRFR